MELEALSGLKRTGRFPEGPLMHTRPMRNLSDPKPTPGGSSHGWTRRFQLPFALGLVLGAFSLGRATSPPVTVQEALDPRRAAEQVSKAFQAASAEASKSVVLVKAGGRRGRGQEGSGLIVRNDGLVVTNQHVVANATRLTVTFTDGRESRAELLGADASIDLAVLKIVPTKGAPKRVYDAMPLRTVLPPVGELVLAVGNPLSLGHTVTLGVVNGLGRNNLDIADYENYIQTDAAINPGNSGGPLIDVQGRAIGVTVAVGLRSNGDGGLAFAIPASMVQRVIDQILEHGRVRRSQLGVRTYREHRFRDPTATNRTAGYANRSRVKVQRVIEDTPAARGGIRVDDILISIAGKKIYDTQSYRNILIESDPGDRVEVVLWRAGKQITKSIELTER